MESISRQHILVMLEPVLKLLSCRAGELYVDATLGGGGYARAILEASAPDGILLALDWDAEALVRASKNLQEYGRRLFLTQANCRYTVPSPAGRGEKTVRTDWRSDQYPTE